MRPAINLHTADNNVWAGVFDQKMDVIAGKHLIQHRKTEAFLASIPSAENLIRLICQLTPDLANSIRKRFKRSEAVERLERFEPNLVGWLAALAFLEHLF